MSGKELTLNVVFRSFEDGSVVAECLELPGCMSQGETEGEAKKNIIDAIESCLSVILEDRLKAADQRSLDLVGIEKQETVTVAAPRILQAACT